MRLGLIRYRYQPAGGAERTLWLLAQGLLARGHEVHALVADWRGEAPEGLVIHQVAGRPGPAFARSARETLAGLGLDHCLSLERVPGVAWWRAGDGVHAAWLARRSARAPWWRRLGYALNPRHRDWLDLERRVAADPGLEGVIANSRLVAGELSDRLEIAPEKITLVRNGVDHAALLAARGERGSAREGLGLEKSRPTLLFLGSGFERKGLALAIRALAGIAGARLLVAGRDDPAPYRRLAARLKVAERVSFLGARGDAPRLLAAADALVLPTLYDPCANATLEALAAGLPVVTTPADGASELVVDGVNGFVAPDPGQPWELGRICRAALALGRLAPSPVPTLEEMVAATLRLLEKA